MAANEEPVHDEADDRSHFCLAPTGLSESPKMVMSFSITLAHSLPDESLYNI
jgi:hypothetical protein